MGSISAITPVGNDEKGLQITPEEIFYGAPSAPLTVLTSQGACLPTLAVGDRWLFYLRKENGKPIVLDYYGNAQEEIETLRELKTIGDFGIVRGSIERRLKDEMKVVPGAQVIASRKSSETAQFFATTDANGHFEFSPLPPGTYKLTVDPIGSFHPDDSSVNVRSGSCWNVTMSRSPHGHISRHLRHSDGSPASDVPVLIMDADGSGFNTVVSDANGYFLSDYMTAGNIWLRLIRPMRHHGRSALAVVIVRSQPELCTIRGFTIAPMHS